MRRCSALTTGGGRCQRIVSDGSDFCYSHDPDRAEQRKRGASKAGKTGGRGRAREPRAAEARGIRADLLRMAGLVEAGELDRGKAAVAGQLMNYALAALRTELKAEELDDLVPRMEAIERRLEQERGSAPWR
jgi:hypothetical protein